MCFYEMVSGPDYTHARTKLTKKPNLGAIYFA